AIEAAARAEALDASAKADDELADDEARVQGLEDALRAKQMDVDQLTDAIEHREAQLSQIQRDVQSRFDRARGLEQDIHRKRDAVRSELETRAGIKVTELIRQMSSVWIEDARAKAAALVRNADQSTADPQHDREARRVMEIAAARCSMHFL